jgi:hypothetical protein
MSKFPWIAQIFTIGKKQTYAVYGEDPEGDGIPPELEIFREMTLKSIGETNWATGPWTNKVVERPAITTSNTRPKARK